MAQWVTAYKVGHWMEYELALLGTAAMALLFYSAWLVFKKNSVIKTILMIFLVGISSTACMSSRLEARKFEALLDKGTQIEVVYGEFRYGEYRFTYNAKHGVEHRKVYVGDKMINIYHSGYLPSHHCYLGLYHSSTFKESTKMRFYIHWVDYSYQYKNQQYQLQAPCILKIEHLSAAEPLLS